MDQSTEVISDRSLKSSEQRSPLISKIPKIFHTLEEAFAAFDSEDKGVEIVLPPIPKREDILSQLMQNALLLVDSGEYALARNILSEVIKKYPTSVEAIRWTGWCYKQEGYFDKAQTCYEELIKLRKTDQDFYELGEIFFAQGFDEMAIGIWQQAFEYCGSESPHLFDLYKGLGNTFTRLGDFDSAEENYNKAHTIRNHSDVLQVNFGTLAFQRQNYLQAMAYFKAALEINPFNDKAWCGVSLVAKEMKDLDWARATVLKALDINLKNETAQQILKVLDHGS